MTVQVADTQIGVSRGTFLGLLLVAGAVVLLGETLATLDRPTVAVVWGSLGLAVYAAGLMCLAGAMHNAGFGLALWKLGPWFLLWYGLVFGIATLTWSQPQSGLATEIAVPSVLRALGLVAVGLTAWMGGYLIGPGHPLRRLATQVVEWLGRRVAGEVRSPAAPWILYAVGIVASLATAATTGKFGFTGYTSSSTTATGYTGVLGALSFCAPLAVSAAALQVFRERLPGARLMLTALFLIQLVFGAAAGVKSNFVITVLAMAIPFAAARRRLPISAIIALALVFLVVIIPFTQAYRTFSRQGLITPQEDVAAAPKIFRQAVSNESVTSVLPQSIGYLGARMREINNPAIIMQRTEGQVAFLSPLQLIEEPVVGMVPRAVWPGKPIFVTGTQMTVEFYEEAAGTSSADTLIGGLYWHGGWLPVVIGMFLFGCGVRLLDDVLDVRANPHAIFLVLLLVPSWVGGEEDWLSLVTSVPATLFVWILAVRLTFRARRS